MLKVKLVIFCCAFLLKVGAQVGIGTTTPQMQLHVSSADSAVALLENRQAPGVNVSNGLYFRTGGVSPLYTGAIKTIGLSASQARLGFFTHGSGNTNLLLERLSIYDDGNVGIGVTVPQATLTVARGTGVQGTAAFYGTVSASHFNYSTAEDTYIRGGKAGSRVVINDASYGAVAIGSGTSTVNINGQMIVAGPIYLEGQLEVSARVKMPVRHSDFFTSSIVTVNNNDYTVLIDFTTNSNLGRIIVLPAASEGVGIVYNIVAINMPVTNSIPANIFEINKGTAIAAINSTQLSVTVQSDGTSWYVINRGRGY